MHPIDLAGPSVLSLTDAVLFRLVIGDLGRTSWQVCHMRQGAAALRPRRGRQLGLWRGSRRRLSLLNPQATLAYWACKQAIGAQALRWPRIVKFVHLAAPSGASQRGRRHRVPSPWQPGACHNPEFAAEVHQSVFEVVARQITGGLSRWRSRRGN